MQAMFESLSHRLTGGQPLLSRSVMAALPEGRMAAGLGEIQGRYPEVEIGSYPFHKMGIFGARLVLRSTDEQRLAAASEEVEAMVERLGDEAKA
jgi:molybdopterin-biosynthesis enzyme MoeA-like protein